MKAKDWCANHSNGKCIGYGFKVDDLGFRKTTYAHGELSDRKPGQKCIEDGCKYFEHYVVLGIHEIKPVIK